MAERPMTEPSHNDMLRTQARADVRRWLQASVQPESKTYYLVGEIVTSPEAQISVQLVGIFEHQGHAELACTSFWHFIAPITLDQQMPKDVKDWPGVYFPQRG
jgi:hypothetical protein